MKPDLSQLRDIHLPPPVSWWPPAPGWWAVATLVLLLIVLTTWLLSRHRRNRWRRQALAALAQLRSTDDALLLRELSVLLRRIAIGRFPQQEVAALTGDAWLAFLDHTLGDDGSAFRAGPGRALAAGPYAAAVDIDASALLNLCERWIRQLPGGVR